MGPQRIIPTYPYLMLRRLLYNSTRSQGTSERFRDVINSNYNTLVHIPRRCIVIPRSKNSKNKPIHRKTRHVTLENINPSEVMSIQDPKLIEFKIKQLNEYTRQLKEKLRKADGNKIRDDEFINSKEDSENNTGNVLLDSFNTDLMIPSDSSVPQNLSHLIDTVATSQIEKLIPSDARDIVGNDELVIKSLSNKKNTHWNSLIDKLTSDTSNFKILSEDTINNWLLKEITYLPFKTIEKLDSALGEWSKEHKVPVSASMYDCIFRLYSKLTPMNSHNTEKYMSDTIISNFKELIARMDESSVKPTEFNLTACITYCSKLKAYEPMNYFLEKFQKEYGLTPNKHTYTKIIQFYDGMGLQERAWNTFDTMKFLSTSHKPDIFTYNLMLHICDRQKNYSKAIDLFYEMEDQKLTPNHSTFTIIAKTLASSSADNIVSEGNSDSLRLLGWKFINKMFYQEDFHSVASMMALAAYDGDVALCRALFFKFTMNEFASNRNRTTDQSKLWTMSIKPVLFNYLLTAYSRFKAGRMPLILGWPEGVQMRRTILNSVDYTGKLNDTSNNLPFLPLLNLTSTEQALAESNALWKFVLSNGNFGNTGTDLSENLNHGILGKIATESSTFDQFKFNILRIIGDWKIKNINNSIFNHICLVSYLSIPLRLNNAAEFWERLDTYTFKESEFDEKLLELYYQKKLIELKQRTTEEESTNEMVERSPFNTNVEYLTSIGHKILYESSTFELAMKGATKFDNLERAKREWIDRGKFRKTANYMQLPKAKKSHLDAEFAKTMVNFFVSQRKYDEAMSIVLTSKKYIRWEYGMIKNLMRGLESIEDRRNITILLDIINKKPSELAYINKQIANLDLNIS